MESEKNSKSAKEEKPQVLLSASLPLSDTQEHPLAPLKGESAAEGRIDYALVPLSGSLPLSGAVLAQSKISPQLHFHPSAELTCVPECRSAVNWH
ncbi:hypothetical protein LR48_Vigan10g148800 [Vigna angularis]|uniref:Uncharacterized protein n=1 Tax=Phaseolus angularis TaxID=3914 RepID=A0A0L9VKL2_PHAAN|nr:hypothetical protein LR48_Vigan10g148800 [Vigna angularis]